MKDTEYVEILDENSFCGFCDYNCEHKRMIKKDIHEDPINLQNRKFVANNIIGLLGKYKDEKCISTICDNQTDCNDLVMRYKNSYFNIISNNNNDELYIHN